MQRIAFKNLLVQVSILSLGFVMPLAAHAQDAAPAAAAAASPADAALVKVREAIGQRNFDAARQALDELRRIDPNHPGIALYERMMERPAGNTQSPVRTPRAGVTPAPTPEPTPAPTPAPTPEPTPAAVTAPATSSASAKSLTDNPAVLYGAIAAAVLLLLGAVWFFLKKRKQSSAPIETSSSAFGSSEEEGSETFGLGTGATAGLSSSPLSTDFGFPSSDAPLSSDENSPAVSPLGSSALGGALSGGAPAFTPTFGLHDEEEEAPRPPKPQFQPKPKEEDDSPVNLFGDDEPASSSQTTLQPVQPEASSETASFEALGINLGHAKDDVPFSDQETVVMSDDKPQSSTGSSPALDNTGTVNLEDIFGSQPLPGTADADEPGSQTLSTFVSEPNLVEPVESAKTDNTPAPAVDTQSISLDELFSSTVSEANAAEAPAEPASSGNVPFDEMETRQLPFEEMPTIMPEPEPEAPAPRAEAPGAMRDETSTGETLDERSERMYLDQMEKARAAFEEKNWKQAVHFLSIASALHPESEDARQMLREARAEKRKAEESV